MSGSNAISGITLIGALASLKSEHLGFAIFLSTLAIIFATINVVGGYAVTNRMLEMFKKKDKGENDGAAPTNKGKLQIDATVSDQYIKFPTNTNLMNEGRKKLEKIIDDLYEKKGEKGTKPRTYRRKLDQAYLFYSKKRNKSTSSVRKMKRKLLESLSRDLRHIDKMLDEFDKKGASFPLNKKELKYLWVIRLLYKQQLEMYRKRTHSIEDRIVNIHQPYVRPIVKRERKIKDGIWSQTGSKPG
jgi:hypothetical protein